MRTRERSISGSLKRRLNSPTSRPPESELISGLHYLDKDIYHRTCLHRSDRHRAILPATRSNKQRYNHHHQKHIISLNMCTSTGHLRTKRNAQVIAEEHRAVPPALAIHTRRGGGGWMEEKGESADLIVEIRNDR